MIKFSFLWTGIHGNKMKLMQVTKVYENFMFFISIYYIIMYLFEKYVKIKIDYYKIFVLTNVRSRT